MVRRARPPWAAAPRIAVDGDGRPWPLSDDADFCFACGQPTGERHGAGDPCCWTCPGGGQDRREGRKRAGRREGWERPGRAPRPLGAVADVLAQVTSAAPGTELDVLARAAAGLRPLVAAGQLDLDDDARQLYWAGRQVGLADGRVKQAIEAGLA